MAGTEDVSGKLLKSIKNKNVGSSACLKAKVVKSEFLRMDMSVKQGCIMSPWLFNVQGWDNGRFGR